MNGIHIYKFDRCPKQLTMTGVSFIPQRFSTFASAHGAAVNQGTGNLLSQVTGGNKDAASLLQHGQDVMPAQVVRCSCPIVLELIAASIVLSTI